MSLQDTGLFNTETIDDSESANGLSRTNKLVSKRDSPVSRHGSIAESRLETAFRQLVEAIRHQLKPQKHIQFTVSLAGEETEFVRFNGSQVRQTGHVQDGQIVVTLMGTRPSASDCRTNSMTLPFTGEFVSDWAMLEPALCRLLAELAYLPSDHYAVLPNSNPGHPADARSREVYTGELLSGDRLVKAILDPVQFLDFSGLYAGGSAYRAYADSAGKQHWFETPSFTLDYSLFGEQDNKATPHRAVKGTLAGKVWDSKAYADHIFTTAKRLRLLSTPVKAIPRGSYRTYLAPAAVADLMDTIVWGGGLGESALRQGNSAFSQLEQGKVRLSEKFSLQEDFQRVAIPRFNSTGEFAPARLPVIKQGRWINSLVNSRSAKEYGKASNGANAEEAMRVPAVAGGTLDEADILSALGTGLYLSNLHYLNWSDLNAGRITGMTRYACFWVEAGEIVAPIENLRFDDDLYRFLGEGLIDLTRQQTFLPAVGTYDRRSLGGMWMPGMLIDQFRYTL